MTTGTDARDERRDQLDNWPNCATPDCMYKRATWLATGLCTPCSIARLGFAQVRDQFRLHHPGEDLFPAPGDDGRLTGMHFERRRRAREEK